MDKLSAFIIISRAKKGAKRLRPAYRQHTGNEQQCTSASATDTAQTTRQARRPVNKRQESTDTAHGAAHR